MTGKPPPARTASGAGRSMRELVAKLGAAVDERRRLRKLSGYQIAIADRLDDLNVERWRAVTDGHSFFHSPRYLRFLQELRGFDVTPRYALISSVDTPVATVCLQILSVDLRNVGSVAAGAKTRLEPLRARVKQRVLVCGNLLVYGLHGVCFAEGADRAKAWAAVTEVLYRIRRAEKLAGHTDLVLIKDLDEAELAESRVVAKLSYGAVPTEPNMVLTLDPAWRSHDDYLKSLASKFRSDIKNRVLKKFADAGASLDTLEDIPGHTPVLHELYLQVQRHAKLRPLRLPSGYWAGLAEAGGPDVVFHVARHDGRIVGFIACVKDGATALAYHIGFDRKLAEAGVPVYLRLLHAAVAQGIAFGCREVSFGRTALEPKARLGCKPRDTYVWARHRQPMFNQLIQPLLRLVHPEEAPSVSPFKAGSGGDA